jgi:DNA-binding transcriptional LysR family regulator
METLKLRDERLCAAIPRSHPWASKETMSWASLASQPLVVLARREGAGLHDEILASCHKAGFTPKISHTPSVISTVLRFVESGAGIGIVPECLAETDKSPRWSAVRLTPRHTIPLVLVWKKDQEEEPAARAFRTLLAEWVRDERLWA